MEYNDKIIEEIVSKNGYKKEMCEILIKMCEYLKHKQIYGACHESASVLYVLLSEIGYEPILCVGEVKAGNYLFDHSWIEIDNKIIDIAISMTLEYRMSVSEPIILDINSKTNKKTIIKYGMKNPSFDETTRLLLSLSFNQYMDLYPNRIRGLWDVVEEILGKSINIEELKKKYGNTKRIIKAEN